MIIAMADYAGKPCIIVTGANGQLGLSVKDIAADYPAYEFLFFSKQALSIFDEAAVTAIFEKHQPAACINCAAYTAVDAAEKNTEEAFLVNAEGAAVVAKASKKFNTQFFHISTDYVFNGNAGEPYEEDALTDPLNQYGASKAKGEELVLKYNSGAIIIRTSWVYSEHGKNFVKTMIRLLTEKPGISVVNDQYGSPTYAGDLAKAILQIIVSGLKKPGIYHYSNQGVINWFEFATAIKEAIKSNCSIQPIPAIQYPTPAQRPAYAVLNTSKIVNTFNLHIPLWNDSLRICLAKLANG